MSDANLRRILPESESIIRSADKIIIESSDSKTTVSQFGNIVFDRSNFELSNDLDSNITLAQQISSDIYNYVDKRINTIVIPEILCLYYKEFTNSRGTLIGQSNIATTNLSLNYFQVSTIRSFDGEAGVEFSVDASGLEDALQDNGINLSPGIYKIECTGAFTLTGPAGYFRSDGTSVGNGDRGYLNLELYKDTEPNESLLVSTPIIDYAPEVKITSPPESWCGTKEQWELYLKSNYEPSTTQNTYMYGFISICKGSNIKLKAHTAGTYIIGYPNPDSESELPPSLYNPIQIIFEKITDNPFEFDITPPEVDILSTVPQRRSTTTTTTRRPGDPDNPVTTTTTTRRPGDPDTTPRPPSGDIMRRAVGQNGAEDWIVPDGVTSISVVAVGGGGGGAATNDQRPNGGNGGDLRWRNNIPVNAGNRIKFEIGEGGTSFEKGVDGSERAGTDGGDTVVKIGSRVLVKASGGKGGQVSKPQPPNDDKSSDRSLPNIGGGNGGRGGNGANPSEDASGAGGGGAGGYTGPGGDGGDWKQNGRNGAGGGGGGGHGGGGNAKNGGGGGGVGLFGQGNNGEGGKSTFSDGNGRGGKIGSKRNDMDFTEQSSFGFLYGGGGGGKGETGGIKGVSYRHGGNGAVRIIWGPGKSFPNNAII